MRKIINLTVSTCPLDVLSKMGEEIRGAKILFSLSAFDRLIQTANKIEKILDSYFLSWDATECFPQTTVITEAEYLNDTDYTGYVYHAVYINASDICFRTQWEDCCNEYLLILKE